MRQGARPLFYLAATSKSKTAHISSKAQRRYGDQGKRGRYSGRKRTGSPQPEIEGPEKTTKKKKPEGFDMLRYFQRKPDKDDDGRPPPGRFDSYEGDGGGAGMGGLLA